MKGSKVMVSQIPEFSQTECPIHLKNPFEALRKLGDEEENLVRPERVSALESSREKIIFRRQNSNLGIVGISTYLEGEKTSTEKREKHTSKEEKAANRHFII